VRHVTLAVLILISIVTIAELALARQGTFQVTMTQMPQGKRIGIVAYNVQHGGRPRQCASAHYVSPGR
jgi:hypothetical protein